MDPLEVIDLMKRACDPINKKNEEAVDFISNKGDKAKMRLQDNIQKIKRTFHRSFGSCLITLGLILGFFPLPTRV